MKVEFSTIRGRIEALQLELNSHKIQGKLLAGIGTVIKKIIKKSYSHFLKSITGNLLNNVKRFVRKDKKSVIIYSAAYENKIQYGFVQAKGASILPKSDSVMRFKTSDGNWVTSKGFKIPAKPWVQVAEDYPESTACQIQVDKIIQKEINRIVNS